ncbi:ATP-binding protein [uncultured Lacinutrix sp.]|uniref:ATP-binding protein n=1 Tax=uncultured Lacinutrix sp. TaxID=574032 RepID=UPI00260F9B6A|nr:ATP-binding protein [uncultured Lacinutrix sp.]
MKTVKNNVKPITIPRNKFDACIKGMSELIIHRITAENNSSNLDLESSINEEFSIGMNALLQLEDGFSLAEKIILLLAVLPHIQPGFVEKLMSQVLPNGGEFVAFGGVKGQQYRGIMPTGETALYILAGTNIEERLKYQQLFNSDCLFAIHGLLQLHGAAPGEPIMSGKLIPDPDWLEKILLGKESAPVYSVEFPARKIQTEMLWEDLVLHPQTLEQINDIQIWMEYNQHVLKDVSFGRKIKPGYRVLFYGQAGTGKTLTASLLGKKFDIPVYRIDLSLVVSKYIGETEKHIEMVFNRAERKNWILFFDEADALFGKRTSVQSSNDKFANQEVSYLLQRIEDFKGLLILASNFKNNIDDAFLRRFHNIIHFPIPGASERYKLWTQSIPQDMFLKTEIDWKAIAEKYEMTGAEIINVMYYASLRAYAKKSNALKLEDIYSSIKKEFAKQDKIL